jgi:hypothetical protein
LTRRHGSMKETWKYAKMFARYPVALRRFLREPLTLERAQAIVRKRMKQRAENFVAVAERAVFGHAASPYLALLKHAGCELGDLRALVNTRGLEGALIELGAAGVYVRFEEFKGREPIVRNGLELPVKASDFDNPFARHDFALHTGGSTGLSTLVGQDLDHIAASAPIQMLMLDAYGLLDAPTAHWMHILPGTGSRFLLQRAYFGQYSEHWYSSMGWRDSKGWPKYDLATIYMISCARRLGAPLPYPTIVRLDEAIVVARWVHDTVAKRGRAFLSANVSHALRVAVAAQEAGLDLSGATFRVGGEPITPAKARIIAKSGVRVVPAYGMVEISTIGLGCPNGHHADDVHLAMDTLALVAHPHRVDGTDVTVPAFRITTIADSVTKLMLNVQVDDYGVVDETPCGCPLEAYGYTVHLRDIRSYSKLVGEGVTLIGNDMVRILEHVLPERFGGTALDYQLSEEEDEQGLTRLYLVVSPRVSLRDEEQIVDALIEALRASSAAAGVAGTVWRQAQTIRVKRAEPVWTARGKLLPLHMQRFRQRRPDSASSN